MGYTQHTIYSTQHTIENGVFPVLWEMKKNGLSEHTIKFVGKVLKVIEKGCGFSDPDAVKSFIAGMDTAESYKRNLCYAYGHWLKLNGLTWEKPKYYARDKLPRIPEERVLDMIIAASPAKLAVKLSISKETGLRPVELLALKVKDVDLTKGIIYPATAKHGSARTLKIKSKTLDMLKTHIHKQNLGTSDQLFTQISAYYASSFRYFRNKIATKLEDPAIKTIRLYDLRHFFATKLYHQTKDILFVKTKMGHRKISTTLRYTQLVEIGDDSYTVKVASSLDEYVGLLEQGFTYVSDYDGAKILRKRK